MHARQRGGLAEADVGVRYEEREEPGPISTLPLPPLEVFGSAPALRSHNLYRATGECSWRSDNIILATFFNGGVRADDLTIPFQRRNAYFVPGAPSSRRGRGADQRRVLGRPRAGVRRGPVYGRAVYPGDEHLGGNSHHPSLITHHASDCARGVGTQAAHAESYPANPSASSFHSHRAAAPT